MPHFSRYFGIDYSGAQTPTSSLPEHFAPALTPAERTTASLKGWILGLH